MVVLRIKNNFDFIDNLSVAIGQFDGLHIAHQALLNKTIDIAKTKNLKSAIMTFDPHPDFVLKKQNTNNYITPIEEKISLLEKIGLDYLLLVEFDLNVAGMEPKLFVENYLVKLGVKEVVVGFDFKFGKFGKGKAENISDLSNNLINTTIISEIKNDNVKIGSSLIRQLLMEGNVHKVNELLSRPYFVTGKVITGNRIGNKIGVPTANIDISNMYVPVKPGVYSVIVEYNGNKYRGICNYGHNPSFNYLEKKSMETFILDFNEDLYGKQIVINFIDFLRNEEKFNSIDEFKEQINLDIEKAKNIKL